MPFRSDQHAQAVARRLELLSAEPAPTLLPDPFAPAVPNDEPPPVPRPGRHAARRGPEWLPESLRGRIALGPAQVAVVAVAIAVGLAVTAWWVLRSQPQPVMPSPIGAPLVSRVGASSASATGSPAELVVDVEGRVRRPGIVVLSAGSRVVDALEAAGGARPRVDLSTLNLARQVVDGEQILVGLAPAPGVAASAATVGPGPAGTGALINLNLAGSVELEELPGVGPVTAAAIIAFRDEHGAFTAVDQLLDVSGIGDAILSSLHVVCQA